MIIVRCTARNLWEKGQGLVDNWVITLVKEVERYCQGTGMEVEN